MAVQEVAGCGVIQICDDGTNNKTLFLANIFGLKFSSISKSILMMVGSWTMVGEIFFFFFLSSYVIVVVVSRERNALPITMIFFFYLFVVDKGVSLAPTYSLMVIRKSDLHSSLRTKHWLSCFYLFLQDIFRPKWT